MCADLSRPVPQRESADQAGPLPTVGEVAPAKGSVPGTCPVFENFDPLSPEFLADPYQVMAAMPLDEAPVFYAPAIDYFVVTRYADVSRVFRDPATFSARAAQLPLAPLVPEAQQILFAGSPRPSMVSLDEPEHARLRKPAARAFTARRVTEMVPRIRATAGRLLDAVGDVKEFDLIEALASPLPAEIVFSLIGVPVEDYAQLKHWCGHRAALSWGRPAPEVQVEIATNIAAYRGYLHQLVQAKVDSPADDLTSELVRIHAEAPDQLDLVEIASILFSLSFAGHETTTGLIGNAARRLLEEPGAWNHLVQRPGRISAAVEEVLRFDPPVPAWRRVTTKAVTLGDVDLPEGAKLFLWLAAANRDGSVFARPGDFDLGRDNSDQHLAFGGGIHFCLGANLGKLEARVALEVLIRRFPSLRLVEDQRLSFHPNISFRGPLALHVTTP